MRLEPGRGQVTQGPVGLKKHWSLGLRAEMSPCRAVSWAVAHSLSLLPSIAKQPPLQCCVHKTPFLCAASCMPQPHSHVLSLPGPPCSAGAVRASSIFPILSVILLFMGGLCIAASEFYKTRHNIILSAGIFFVSAGNDHGARQARAGPTSGEKAEVWVGGPGRGQRGICGLAAGGVEGKAGCAGLLPEPHTQSSRNIPDPLL